MPCSYFYGDSLISPYVVTAFLHAEFLYLRHYWISSNSQTCRSSLGIHELRKNKISTDRLRTKTEENNYCSKKQINLTVLLGRCSEISLLIRLLKRTEKQKIQERCNRHININ